jgi:hypothetical protein
LLKLSWVVHLYIVEQTVRCHMLTSNRFDCVCCDLTP